MALHAGFNRRNAVYIRRELGPVGEMIWKFCRHVGGRYISREIFGALGGKLAMFEVELWLEGKLGFDTTMLTRHRLGYFRTQAVPR